MQTVLVGYQFNEGAEWGFVLCNKIVRLIRYDGGWYFHQYHNNGSMDAD